MQSKRFREVDTLILFPLGKDTFYHRYSISRDKSLGEQGSLLLLNDNKTMFIKISFWLPVPQPTRLLISFLTNHKENENGTKIA